VADLFVFASGAKQSSKRCKALDCFVALLFAMTEFSPSSPFGLRQARFAFGEAWWSQAGSNR
jgi:hypothetical protein